MIGRCLSRWWRSLPTVLAGGLWGVLLLPVLSIGAGSGLLIRCHDLWLWSLCCPVHGLRRDIILYLAFSAKTWLCNQLGIIIFGVTNSTQLCQWLWMVNWTKRFSNYTQQHPSHRVGQFITVCTLKIFNSYFFSPCPELYSKLLEPEEQTWSRVPGNEQANVLAKEEARQEQLFIYLFIYFVYYFLQLYCYDFSHKEFRLLFPGKASCNRVTLPNLWCMLGILVFP